METKSLQPKIIDYDAIYKELLDGVDYATSTQHSLYHMSVDCYIREIRSISFAPPRQLGKTRWIISMLKNDPTACMIVTHMEVKEVLLADFGAQDPSLENRIFTARDIWGMYKDKTKPSFRKFFLDDSVMVFDRVKQRVFYKWVASALDPNVLVIRM